MSDDLEMQQTVIGDPDNRPIPSTNTGITTVETGINQQEKLADYLGKLMLIQPLQHELWDTQFSVDTDVLVSYVIVIEAYQLDANNSLAGVQWLDFGEVPIFWQYLKGQLDRQANAENPWVLGKLDKGRQAYRLLPPIPEDIQACVAALDEWKAATVSEMSS